MPLQTARRLTPHARMTTHDKPPTTDTPIVAVHHTDVVLASTPILHDIDWTLFKGQHCGIVGSNGSGKSTLLALIAGTAWPAPGRGERQYFFGAKPQRDAVEARRHIATVGPELQDRYLHRNWNFRARDIVLSGVFRTDVPRRRPTDAERHRAIGLLRHFGIAPLAERRFLELSRGEQRRVLIARAMAFEPQVLVLDEPASGLDQDARKDLDATLAQIAATTTIVVSAHNDADLPSITRQVLELQEGRIVKRRALRRPQHSAPALLRHTAASATGELLIAVRNADVWLQGRRVLVGLNWQLRVGEHWMIRGPNGAGKSTFLKLLHGQLRPALGGLIEWPGLGNPSNIWMLRRQIGYLSPEYQAAYRFPTTVADCVASGFHSSVGLTRRPDSMQLRRVAELLQRFALDDFAKRELRTLSYGQMRRALLARAFATRPRVLLLDEPWAGLDAEHSKLVGRQLRDSMNDGTHLVCASHLADSEGFTHLMELSAGCIANAAPTSVSRVDAGAARHEN